MASAFGVFQIVANDGRQDHMLMATELLNKRIEKIKAVRRQAGFEEAEVFPSLLDIERTHIIFVTAHFKPFAAIAFEYHRVDPESARNLNSTIKYSIPQYGDFFADMAHYVSFNQLTYTSGVAAATVDDEGYPNTGGFAIYGQGNPNADVYRYCDFPGERLHRLVKFSVNGNPLDQYTHDAYVMNRQFCLPPNKVAGYYRLVGQELPHEAYLDQESNDQPQTRVQMKIFDGYQTPSSVQPALEVTVPLLFWFCKDFRLSVPSVAIPYGQRWVEIRLAESKELVELVAPSGSANTDTTVLGPLELKECALYVNNLFVNSEIHDIFIRRIGFTLIRVHLWHEQQLTQSQAKIRLSSLQWPVEAMFFGFRPIINYDLSTAQTLLVDDAMYSRCGGFGTLQNWHRFGNITLDREAVYGIQSNRVDTQAQAEMQVIANYTGANPAAGTIALEIAQFHAYLVAQLPGVAGLPASRWGQYSVGVIDGNAAYQSAFAGSVAALRAMIDRQANQYKENLVWTNVAVIPGGTAAAQVAAYTAAYTAYDALPNTTLTHLTTDLINVINTAAASFGANSVTVWDAVQLSGFLNHAVQLGGSAMVEVRRSSPSVNWIGLEAHNVKLYTQQYESFFNSYLTYVYGGPNLNTPEDRGLYLISFALYPGTYQPSGHINISRTREFDLNYQSSRPITADNPVQLLVYVSAINFLLIADGSASLRYTT